MSQTTWKQVVTDIADAYREASGTTAKIPIGSLASKVRDGSENLDQPLTELESTLQEILDILPYKGYQNSGQYVWKEYEYVADATITMTMTNYGESGQAIIQLTSADFDVRCLDINDLAGIKVGYSHSGGSWVLEFKDDRNIILDGNSYPMKYDESTGQIRISANFGAIVTFASPVNATVKVFSRFVISDEVLAYPNSGEQGGRWYELVEEVDAFDFSDILGYTRCSVTTFTFSSRTAINNAVTHALTGEIPKFAMIVAKSPIGTTNNDLYLAVGLKNTDSNNGVISIAQQFVYGSSYEQKVSKVNVQFGVNRNETGNIFLDSNSIYYTAGVEYYLIVAM